MLKHKEYYDKLIASIKHYPENDGQRSIAQLEQILGTYERVLNDLRNKGDRAFNTTTAFWPAEIKSMERKLQTAQYGKTEKEKREAFYGVQKYLKDDVEQLARTIKPDEDAATEQNPVQDE
jgi:hypothetical protein